MLFTKIEKKNCMYPLIGEYIEEDSDYYDEELLSARVEYIKNLKFDQINDVCVVNEFDDDHCLCFNVDIIFKDGNVLSVLFGWMAPSYIGMLYYWKDSVTAQQHIIEYLQEGFK